MMNNQKPLDSSALLRIRVTNRLASIPMPNPLIYSPLFITINNYSHCPCSTITSSHESIDSPESEKSPESAKSPESLMLRDLSIPIP